MGRTPRPRREDPFVESLCRGAAPTMIRRMQHRVLVIGARRTRQGIGEFVARWFHGAGAVVEAVVGTSADSATDAAATLTDRYGIDARPFADLDTALAEVRPTIVAICSPFDRHPEHLRSVAAAGAHCLCEKPMVWRDEGELRTWTAGMVDPFLERGLHLDLVTQWPETLPDYFRLYPEVETEAPERFEMLLSPISVGARAVLDSVPHVLSLLSARLGRGAVIGPEAAYGGADRGELTLEFEYKPRSGDPSAAGVAVTCRFVTQPEPPRPAGYAWNGRWVDRRIRLPEYAMEFVATDGDGDRSSTEPRGVLLEDPLRRLVERFLARVDDPAGREAERAEHRAHLIESVTHLEPLVRAVERLEREGSS